MSFAFGNPLALALGALLVAPILAHLTRQAIRERREFGAMMLVERLQKRLQRRRRLSDRLLLLFRLLALSAFILAVARPEVRWPEVTTSVGATGRVIVVLDGSLSMDQRVGGDSAYTLARTAAAAQVRSLPAGVRVALITVGTQAELVTPAFSEDAALVAALIDEQTQSSGGTDLRGAFLLARTLLEGNPGEILLYTDESGPGTIEACTPDFQRLLDLGTTVVPAVSAAVPPRNISIADASYGDGIEGGSVLVKLVNYGPDPREVPTSVYLPEGARITSFVAVPAGSDDAPGLAETRFTVPRQSAGGVARVEVDDPDLPLDNTRYFHLPRVGASRVMVVDGDPGSTPTRSEAYFLERALAPWGASGPVVDVVAPAGVTGVGEGGHRVVWLANVADPGPMAPTLIDFVRRGGGLVIGMGENVTAERYNSALASLLPAPLRRTRDLVDLDAAGGTALALPDVVGIDLFRAFSRAGREQFASVRARRAMTLEPYAESDEVRTLLRYTDGVPALVERRIGTGRVLVWTGTLDLGWGNLPLQSVFAPLVQRITALLGGDVGGTSATADGVVGVAVDLPMTAPGAEVTGPAGHIVASERTPHGLRFVPELPGEYTIQIGDQPPLARVAVNTPAPESDVRHTASILATQAEIAPDRLTRHLPLQGVGWTIVGLGLLAAAVVGRGSGEVA